MSTSLPVISIHRPTRPSKIGAIDRRKRPPRPTKENPLVLSASELRDFLRCRVKWNWRYNVRIVPHQKPFNLAFGGLVHEILEAWYRGEKRSVKSMRRVAKTILAATSPEVLTIDDLDLAMAMCLGYAEWAKPRDAELKMRKIEPEKWFELPLVEDGSIIVRGKIDAVFEVGTYKKTVGCFEHKTKGQIKIDVVDLNLQLSVYLWAVRKLFPRKKRYIAYYNVLRKQAPGPRVKADLFARESIERTDEEIQQWEEDVQRAAMDMLDAAIYPNPTDNCSWDCDYNTPCMLRGRSGDLKAVLKRDFTAKD